MTTILMNESIKIENGNYPQNPENNKLYYDVQLKKFVWYVNGQWINYKSPFGW